MNLSGRQLKEFPHYSKSTKGLRQSSEIMDNDFRLVFVYPIIFDEGVGNATIKTFVDDGNNMQDLIRNYLSVTMLKEIFVSNALNTISLASQIDPSGMLTQRSKLTHDLLGELLGRDRNALNYDTSYNTNSVSPYELQNKVIAKTAIIKQFLASDPRLKALKPFVEIITLQNMIDVPVIVGTKALTVDSASLFQILVGAIASRKKLDTFANVKSIIDKLRHLEEHEIYRLFKIAEEEEDRSSSNSGNWLTNVMNNLRTSVSDRFENSHRPRLRQIGRYMNMNNIIRRSAIEAPNSPLDEQIERIKTEISELDPSTHERKIWKLKLKQDKLEAESSKDNILKFKQSTLDQTELMFKLFLDEKMLKNQTGLSRKAGQMSSVIKRTSGNLINFMSQVETQFHEFINSQGIILLRSIHNILYPDGIPASENFNFIDIKREYFDEELSKNISNFLENEFMMDLEQTLGSVSDPEEASGMTKPLQVLCKEAGKVGKEIIDYKKQIINNSIESIYFTADKFNEFLNMTELIGSKVTTINQLFMVNISRVLNNAAGTLAEIKFNVIGDVVDKFIQRYSRVGNLGYNASAPQTPSRFFFVVPAESRNSETYQSFLKQVKDIIVEYLFFGFLYLLQINLCEYIDILDVEIDIAKDDVMDFPNYTLVIEESVVMALHRIIMAKRWKEMITRGATTTAPNANYVKTVVKFIHQQLGVPNLIVINRKQGIVHYKLMHMTAVLKSNVKTLDTFVKNLILSQQTQRY